MLTAEDVSIPEARLKTCFWEAMTQTAPFDEAWRRLVRFFFPLVRKFTLGVLNGWFLPSPPTSLGPSINILPLEQNYEKGALSGDVEPVTKAARHASDSGRNRGSTCASNNSSAHRHTERPVFRMQCASLRGRALLHARVLLKDLPKLTLTLANDVQEVPR
jgi:hypothetical protein